MYSIAPVNDDPRRYYVALAVLAGAPSTQPPPDLNWYDLRDRALQIPNVIRFTEDGELVTPCRTTATRLLDGLYDAGLYAQLTTL